MGIVVVVVCGGGDVLVAVVELLLSEHESAQLLGLFQLWMRILGWKAWISRWVVVLAETRQWGKVLRPFVSCLAVGQIDLVSFQYLVT